MADNYTSSFQIPTPKGVYQAAGDTNINANYAYIAENIRTERGLLASACGTSRAFPSLGVEVGTLSRFYRRNRPDDPDVFVAAGGGKLYTYTMGSESWVPCSVYNADGERLEGAAAVFGSDKWSCVTYEVEGKVMVDGEKIDVVTDILLMSNDVDGMIVIRGDDLDARYVSLKIGNVTDGRAETVRFSVLGRYAERVWGTGDPAYPDHIFYSRPFDPFDWTAEENDIADQGGGEIRIPTWDGDSFITLNSFSGYLVAVKRNSVFEIRGTDPTTFTVHEAYGTDGPVQGETVCVDRNAMYFLTRTGLGMYDGAALQLLSRDALYELMRMRSQSDQDKAVACVCDHVYYLALAIKDEENESGKDNNVVIELDTERGTFMIRRGIRVAAFYSLNGVVYYTDAHSPFEILRYNDPDASSYLGIPMHCLWETPWLDLGKSLIKRDFVLRFTAEADEKDFPVEMTILTERREKKKTVILQKGRHDYRVKIQNAGKRVKLRIESSGRPSGWRIYGGVQVEYTYDED